MNCSIFRPIDLQGLASLFLLHIAELIIFLLIFGKNEIDVHIAFHDLDIQLNHQFDSQRKWSVLQDHCVKGAGALAVVSLVISCAVPCTFRAFCHDYVVHALELWDCSASLIGSSLLFGSSFPLCSLRCIATHVVFSPFILVGQMDLCSRVSKESWTLDYRMTRDLIPDWKSVLGSDLGIQCSSYSNFQKGKTDQKVYSTHRISIKLAMPHLHFIRSGMKKVSIKSRFMLSYSHFSFDYQTLNLTQFATYR